MSLKRFLSFSKKSSSPSTSTLASTSAQSSTISSASSSSRSSRPSIASINSSFTPKNSNPNSTSSIILQSSAEFEEVSYKDVKEILVMASLKAPTFEQNPEDKRAPIDICCVIDRSGSMAGEKLALAKAALNFVVDNLDSGDSLGVVVYDTNVQILFQFMKMTAEGKKSALNQISQIQTADMTNLCGGLLKGLDIASNRKSPNDICSILLFTDGLANQGITETNLITAEMEKRLSIFSKKPTVFTFGFGSDHNQNMLRTIAEAGGGMYYYLAGVDQIPISFADCLGGLQSVVGQNLSLVIEGIDSVQVIKSLNPKYKITKGSVPSNSITIELGDIYSEENRDVIFIVRLPSLSSPNEEGVRSVRFGLEYFSVLATQDEGAESTLSIKRPDSVSKDLKANEVLDMQRNRLQVAEAMELSRKKADQGDLAGAQEILKNAITTVDASPSVNDKFCQNLKVELDQCLDDMRDQRHYAMEGSKKISRKEQSHYYQRSNKLEESEISFYETSSKVASKSKSKKFVF